MYTYNWYNMRNIYICVVLFISFFATITYAQKPTIYLFPGQGSDYRIFDSIQFDSSYAIVHIQYGIPPKGITLREFAYSLSSQIDTTNPVILIGVSMGGMICSELVSVLHPHKTILLSSAKCRNELPIRYRFQKYVPMYKIFPKRLLYWGALVLQPLVEPDRNVCKSTFKSMLSAKHPLYIKRTIGMITTWDKKICDSTSIIHIHGTNDHTLPIRNIKPQYTISNGSHMMTLTRGREIQTILKQLLEH